MRDVLADRGEANVNLPSWLVVLVGILVILAILWLVGIRVNIG